MSALSFCYLPAIGFGLAATTLVGQSIGARRPREGAELARIATIWSTGLMTVNMVILLLFATPMMRLFTSEPDVIRSKKARISSSPRRRVSFVSHVSVAPSAKHAITP